MTTNIVPMFRTICIVFCVITEVCICAAVYLRVDIQVKKITGELFCCRFNTLKHDLSCNAVLFDFKDCSK